MISNTFDTNTIIGGFTVASIQAEEQRKLLNSVPNYPILRPNCLEDYSSLIDQPQEHVYIQNTTRDAHILDSVINTHKALHAHLHIVFDLMLMSPLNHTYFSEAMYPYPTTREYIISANTGRKVVYQYRFGGDTLTVGKINFPSQLLHKIIIIDQARCSIDRPSPYFIVIDGSLQHKLLYT